MTDANANLPPHASQNSLFRDTARDLPRRWEISLVLILIGVGGLLRLLTLDHDSLWIDEGISVSASNFSPGYLWSVPFDVHPPVYFTLLHAFRTLGDSETILRLPSALASTLTLIPAYLLSRALIGRVGGIITLAVLAGSYVNLTYAVTARNYAVLFLLLLTAFAALHHIWRIYRITPHPRPRAGVLPALVYMFAAAGALYTHNIAVFYILLANIALALHALFARPKAFLSVWIDLALLNLPIVFVWLPWLIVIPGASPDFSWLDQPSLTDAVRTVLYVTTPRAVHAWVGLALIPLILAGVFAAMRRKPVALTVIVFHLIALPGLIWLLGYVYKPVFLERTILPASFGAALAVGACVAYLRRPPIAALVTLIALSCTAVSATGFALRWGVTDRISLQPVEDWRGALSAASDHDADAVILCRLVEYSIARYYYPDADYWVPMEDGRLAPLLNGVWEDVLGRPASSRPDMDAAIRQSVAQRGGEPVSPSDLADRVDSLGIVSSSHCIYNPQRQRWMLEDYPAQLQSMGFTASDPQTFVNVWYRGFDADRGE